jgi:hypothetical protein
MSLEIAEPDAPASEPVSGADDLRADIAAAIAAHSEPAEAATAEDTPPPEAKDGRDEKGRFAGKAAASDTELAGEPDPTAAQQPDRPQAPEGWPADAKTAWDKLPRAVQASLADDLTAGRFRLPGDASGAAADPIVQTAREYEQDAAQVGVTLAEYQRNTLDWARQLARDPVAMLPQVARALGVDLSQYAQASQPQGAASAGVSPEVSQLRQEIAELRGSMTQRERADYQQRVSSVRGEIDTWAAEAGADGQPLRPYFAEIPEDAMASRIQLIRSQNQNLPNRDVLQKAYEAEMFAHPAIRQREIARLTAAASKAEDDKRTAAAAKARSVSVRNTPAPMELSEGQPDSIRGAIRAAMQEHRV